MIINHNVTFTFLTVRYIHQLVDMCESETMEESVMRLGIRFFQNEDVNGSSLTNENYMKALIMKVCRLNDEKYILSTKLQVFLHDILNGVNHAFIEEQTGKRMEICNLIKSQLSKFPFLFVIDGADVLAECKTRKEYSGKCIN